MLICLVITHEPLLWPICLKFGLENYHEKRKFFYFIFTSWFSCLFYFTFSWSADCNESCWCETCVLHISMICSYGIMVSSSTYIIWLSGCLFVRLYVSINKRQNGWTDRSKILCGTSHDPRECLWNIKIERTNAWKKVEIPFVNVAQTK